MVLENVGFKVLFGVHDFLVGSFDVSIGAADLGIFLEGGDVVFHGEDQGGISAGEVDGFQVAGELFDFRKAATRTQDGPFGFDDGRADPILSAGFFGGLPEQGNDHQEREAKEEDFVAGHLEGDMGLEWRIFEMPD